LRRGEEAAAQAFVPVCSPVSPAAAVWIACSK